MIRCPILIGALLEELHSAYMGFMLPSYRIIIFRAASLLTCRLRILVAILLTLGPYPICIAIENIEASSYTLQSELSDFPNGGDVLPPGHLAIEWSPSSFSGSSKISPSMYSTDFLLRYGLLERLEIGVYTQGISYDWTKNSRVGFSPLFFDTKVGLLEPEDFPGIESLALQTILQTNLLGSAQYNGGLEPIITLNVDHELPGDLSLEYNIGSMRYMNTCDPRRMDWNVTFTWSVKKQLNEKLNVFIDGFYGSSAIPKVPGMVPVTMGQCTGNPSTLTYYGRVFGDNVVGGGLEWQWTPTLGTYVNIAAGTNNSSPNIMSYLGFMWNPGKVFD